METLTNTIETISSKLNSLNKEDNEKASISTASGGPRRKALSQVVINKVKSKSNIVKVRESERLKNKNLKDEHQQSAAMDCASLLKDLWQDLESGTTETLDKTDDKALGMAMEFAMNAWKEKQKTITSLDSSKCESYSNSKDFPNPINTFNVDACNYSNVNDIAMSSDTETQRSTVNSFKNSSTSINENSQASHDSLSIKANIRNNIDTKKKVSEPSVLYVPPNEFNAEINNLFKAISINSETHKVSQNSAENISLHSRNGFSVVKRCSHINEKNKSNISTMGFQPCFTETTNSTETVHVIPECSNSLQVNLNEPKNFENRREADSGLVFTSYLLDNKNDQYQPDCQLENTKRTLESVFPTCVVIGNRSGGQTENVVNFDGDTKIIYVHTRNAPTTAVDKSTSVEELISVNDMNLEYKDSKISGKKSDSEISVSYTKSFEEYLAFITPLLLQQSIENDTDNFIELPNVHFSVTPRSVIAFKNYINKNEDIIWFKNLQKGRPCYFCKLCKSKFYNKDSLFNHLNIHYKHYFVCKICLHKFCSKKSFMHHRKLKHKYSITGMN